MASTRRTTDYTGRTVDVLAFNGSFSDGRFELDQALLRAAKPSGQVCAGIQKLTQRWVIELLTPRGSMPYLTDRGSFFLNSVRSGKIRTEIDAALSFNFAKDQVAFNLMQEDSLGTYPADEMYGSVDLLGVQVITGSKMTISVRINSLAGSTRVFVVPVSVVPAR
jgi:hypothetical protein